MPSTGGKVIELIDSNNVKKNNINSSITMSAIVLYQNKIIKHQKFQFFIIKSS